MRIRVRLPNQSWCGGEIRVKRVRYSAHHLRTVFGITDNRGHEITFEIQGAQKFADEIVDRIEQFEREEQSNQISQ